METNKKQTAVDWLKEQFKIQSFFCTIKTQEDENFINSLFNQSKQMEESNVCEFAMKAIAEFSQKGKINLNDFYNETYNTETDGN